MAYDRRAALDVLQERIDTSHRAAPEAHKDVLRKLTAEVRWMAGELDDLEARVERVESVHTGLDV